jgi:hypothetical protein
VNYLVRTEGRLRVSWTQRDFVEAGTWGDPGTLSKARIGPDEGFVLESGGTFQGYTQSDLQAFVFREGRVVHLAPEEGIPTARSDCGASFDEDSCMEVGATWKFDAEGRLQVEYRGRNADGTKLRERVRYERRGDALVVVSGNVPELPAF